MQSEVFITCAVTGSGNTFNKSPNIPASPEQIANAAIEAANAGAAIAHIHVRDPDLKMRKQRNDTNARFRARFVEDFRASMSGGS